MNATRGLLTACLVLALPLPAQAGCLDAPAQRLRPVIKTAARAFERPAARVAALRQRHHKPHPKPVQVAKVKRTPPAHPGAKPVVLAAAGPTIRAIAKPKPIACDVTPAAPLMSFAPPEMVTGAPPPTDFGQIQPVSFEPALFTDAVKPLHQDISDGGRFGWRPCDRPQGCGGGQGPRRIARDLIGVGSGGTVHGKRLGNAVRIEPIKGLGRA